jgi:hypothetical protein
VRDDGSQAGVNEEVWSGIGVALPEVDPAGIGGARCKGLKDFMKVFEGWKSALRGSA